MEEFDSCSTFKNDDDDDWGTNTKNDDMMERFGSRDSETSTSVDLSVSFEMDEYPLDVDLSDCSEEIISKNKTKLSKEDYVASPWADVDLSTPNPTTNATRDFRPQPRCSCGQMCWFGIPFIKTLCVVIACIVVSVCGVGLVRLVVYLSTGTPTYSIGKLRATGRPPDFADLLLVGILTPSILMTYVIFKKIFKTWIDAMIEQILVASGNEIIQETNRQ